MKQIRLDVENLKVTTFETLPPTGAIIFDVPPPDETVKIFSALDGAYNTCDPAFCSC